MKMKNTIFTASIVQNRSCLEQLFNTVESLEKEYPQFDRWYFEKVIPETLTGTRAVYTVDVFGDHAGVLILKNSNEKKICTLRVQPPYQGMGIGDYLMRVAIHELKTAHPLITVSSIHIDEFEKLLKKYGFKMTEIHLGKYQKEYAELVFNGHLSEK